MSGRFSKLTLWLSLWFLFTGVFRVSASATFSVDGSYVLRLSATDTQITNTDDITVTVYDAANLPPVAEIYAPEDGAIITAPTDIIGTASSPLLQSYNCNIASRIPTTRRRLRGQYLPPAPHPL